MTPEGNPFAALSLYRSKEQACGDPRDLTPAQCATLAALAEMGCGKEAARKLGISHKTLENHVREARLRLGVEHRMTAVLVYDRWARKQEDAA